LNITVEADPPLKLDQCNVVLHRCRVVSVVNLDSSDVDVLTYSAPRVTAVPFSDGDHDTIGSSLVLTQEQTTHPTSMNKTNRAIEITLLLAQRNISSELYKSMPTTGVRRIHASITNDEPLNNAK
jgi:hypothetical protein